MKNIIPLVVVSALLLNGCSASSLYKNNLSNEAQVTDTTQASILLADLPLPKNQIPVAVYDFQDQTGQFKESTGFANFSSSVTKGGLSVLTKALLDTGNGNWFMVAERGSLNNLLKERQIIRTERSDYTNPNGTRLPELPPLVYGGMLIEGGIIFYDSNAITGGAAAGYFGLSGSAQYSRDIVTVYLRAVNVSTGQVILAVNSSKTVFSYALDASVTRYLSIDKLLEIETGYSVNEPSQIAVRQAIETGLYSLIMEGAIKGTWSFADEAAGKRAIAEYLARRDGPHDNTISPKSVVYNDQTPVPPRIFNNSAPVASQAATAPATVVPAQAPPQPTKSERIAKPVINADANKNSSGGISGWFSNFFGGSDDTSENYAP